METRFALRNYTACTITVQDVNFDGYDYWGNDDPSQLKGIAIPPRSSKEVIFDAYRGANGRAFTLTLSLGDGGVLKVTGDPGATTPGVIKADVIQKSVYAPEIVASTADDGALVFTVFPGVPPLTDWMGALSEKQRNLPMSHIYIPATHDSGTSTTSAISAPKAKTQDLTIMEQLEHGIRLFDIRVKVRSHFRGDPFLIIAHGIADMEISYADVLNNFKTFLDRHPRESIIMLCNQEEKHASETDFAGLMEQANSRYPGLFHPGSSIPSINEAQGTVVLLRRYPGSGGISLVDWPNDNRGIYEGYMNGQTFYTQDYSQADLDEKQQHVREAFHYAAVPHRPWLLNFNSIAVWIISTGTIHQYADPMNAWLLEYLGSNSVLPVTLFLDFPPDLLIRQIISNNFVPAHSDNPIIS